MEEAVILRVIDDRDEVRSFGVFEGPQTDWTTRAEPAGTLAESGRRRSVQGHWRGGVGPARALDRS